MSETSQTIVEMYLTELVERASGDYDPYFYIEEADEPVTFEEEIILEWDWE